MPNHVRQERVRELLKRELGEIIRREIPISEAGLINVNNVELTGDLQAATVFVGILGSPGQRKHALLLLEQQRKHIQWQIGRSVVLKYTPVLKFVEDNSIEKGNRVLEIMEAIEKETPQQ